MAAGGSTATPRDVVALGEEAGVVEREAGSARKLFGQHEIAGAEPSAGACRHERERAEGTAACRQRDTHVRREPERADDAVVLLGAGGSPEELVAHLLGDLGLTASHHARRRMGSERIRRELGREQGRELRLGRIGVGDGMAADALVGGNVDQAEIREVRHAELREPLVALGIVERPRQQCTRLREESLIGFGPAPGRDLALGRAEHALRCRGRCPPAPRCRRASARRPARIVRARRRRAGRRRATRRRAIRTGEITHARRGRLATVTMPSSIAAVSSSRSSNTVGLVSCKVSWIAWAATGTVFPISTPAVRPESAVTASSPAPVTDTNAPTAAPARRRAASVTVCITRSASSSETSVRPTSRMICASASIWRNCSCDARSAVTSNATVMTPVTAPCSSNTGEFTACTSTTLSSARKTAKSPSQLRPFMISAPISDVSSGRNGSMVKRADCAPRSSSGVRP